MIEIRNEDVASTVAVMSESMCYSLQSPPHRRRGRRCSESTCSSGA
jgi:hypothetical protein